MHSIVLLSSESSRWNTYWRKSAKNLRVATPASGRPSRRLTIPDRCARPSRPALSSWRLIIERDSNPSQCQCRSRRVAWYQTRQRGSNRSLPSNQPSFRCQRFWMKNSGNCSRTSTRKTGSNPTEPCRPSPSTSTRSQRGRNGHSVPSSS